MAWPKAKSGIINNNTDSVRMKSARDGTMLESLTSGLLEAASCSA